MKKIFVLFLIVAFKLSSIAQKQYVTWTFSQKKISADEFELIFKATIEPTWHLYSQIETPDGPLPTYFEFEKSKDYKLIGKTSEPKPHLSFEITPLSCSFLTLGRMMNEQ